MGHSVKLQLCDKEEMQGIRLLANNHETKHQIIRSFQLFHWLERRGGGDQGPSMFQFLVCYKMMPKI